MRLHRPVLLGLFLFLTLASPTLPQNTVSESGKTPPIFQANVHVVIMDVVVTDNKDEPVQGLSEDKFQVLEEGHSQTISSFEEHKGASLAQTELPTMPPNVFTNSPVSKPPETINVLLLDALNTPLMDQAYVHSQMVKYLKKIQPGAHVAIFTLASRLRFVQGFTTDSAVLLAALNNKKRGAEPQQSPLLRTTTDDNTDRQLIANMQTTHASEAAIQALQQFQADTAAFQLDSRIQITLQAFEQLARYLSGFPGRKNIIWFSSAFPLSFFPDPTVQDSFNVMRQYGDRIRNAATLLTDAQVAIYPIAAEGLDTDPMYEASSLAVGVSGENTAIQRQKRELQEASVNRAANHSTLDEIARDSGGEAFYNTNGLNDALARVMNNGEKYYTLTYSPTDTRMDGGYRHIQVKLAGPKYNLSYRRGYFTEDTKKQAPQLNDPLQPLMEPGLPDSTQIIYKLRVTRVTPQPPPGGPEAGDNNKLKGAVTRYAAEFAVPVNDIKLDATQDGVHHGNVEVSLVAYDREGKPLNWLNRKTEMSVKPELYDAFLKGGVQLHQEIDIPQEAIYLRTGIYDIGTRKSGTIEVPLQEVSASVIPTDDGIFFAAQSASPPKQNLPEMAVKPENSPLPGASTPSASGDLPVYAALPDLADPGAGREVHTSNPAGEAPHQLSALQLDSEIASYCETRLHPKQYAPALASACEFVLSLQRKLPDVICDREMRREWWVPGVRGGAEWHGDQTIGDLVTAKVTYKNGQEYYDDIQKDGKPVSAAAARLSGSWSDGEFATILQGLFAPASDAKFEFKKEEALHSIPALVFQFHVEARNNKSYFLHALDSNSRERAWFPEYSGQLWLDKSTFRLLRLERKTSYMAKYPITSMKTQIDYAYVPLGDGSSFVLPTNSDVSICALSEMTNIDRCSHNAIKFTNWHKFRAKAQILLNATQ